MRFLRRALVALVLCGLTVLSVCWVVLLFESGLSPDSNFTRYGWVFPVAMFVWAVRSSGNLTRARQIKKMAAAQKPSNTVGHAKLGTTETLTNKEGGIRLVYDKLTGALLRYTKRDGHGLVVGKTGGGKARDWMIAAILDLAGRASMIFADLKGNTTAICGEYLASKGKLIVCSPYENQEGLFPMKLPRSTPINPLAGLSPDKHGFTAECERIAYAFADQTVNTNSENAAHFKDRALDLIAGVIMHVCHRMPEKKRNLTTVRNVLTSSNDEDFWDLVIDAKKKVLPTLNKSSGHTRRSMRREI